MQCALVSTSGELLSKRLGSEIDGNDLVMRLGQAPAGGSLAPYVGNRTSVRYLAGSFFQVFRHMNYSLMHATLEEMQPTNSEVVWVVVQREVLKYLQDQGKPSKPWHEAAGCPPPIPEFMKWHPALPYRCAIRNEKDACIWPGTRQLSSGGIAISLLFETYSCQSVVLYGFANEDPTLPYHYWKDGSQHDNVTTGQWYKNREKIRTHVFEREHRLMHDVLGGCSWTVTAERYRQACQTKFAEEKAATKACASSKLHKPGPTATSARAFPPNASASILPPARLVARRSPFLLLPQYWSRAKAAAARDQVLDAMSRCHDIGEGGDNRTMGVSTVAETDRRRYHLIHAFLEDTHLRKMAASHLGRVPDDVRVKTLAGSTAPGQASGGGWHKDALVRGFKALIYLDDVVDVGVGPFAMLLNYSDSTLKHSTDKRGRRTRFSEASVQDELRNGAHVREILGGAGTVVVFETSSVHRGMPALTGGRVTLTNYYHNTLATCGAK